MSSAKISVSSSARIDEISRLRKSIRSGVRSSEIDRIDPRELGSLEQLTASLLADCPEVRNWWDLGPDDDVWNLRAECELAAASSLLSEVHDAQSRLKEAFQAIRRVGNDSISALEQLAIGTKLNPNQVELVRQRTRSVLFLAMAHSRRGHHLMAKSFLELCIRKLDAFVPRGEKPSYHLRASLAYASGAVRLHIGELDEARGEFRRSVECTMLGLEDALRHSDESSDGDVIAEQKYARYMLAKCFSFGLARVALGAGEVLRALTNASVGIALLAGTHDKYHLAYARMVYGMCLRARFEVHDGQTHEHLDRAEKIFQNVIQDFSTSRHRKRAEYELARVQVHRSALARAEGDTRAAAAFLEKAKSLAEIHDEQRQTTPTRQIWNKILLSRIYRQLGDFSSAKQEAEEVVLDSGDNQREFKVAALIALGEAYRERTAKTLDPQDTVIAEKYFQEALKLSNPISLNGAACRLHLILCAVVRNDPEVGQRYLRQWEDYRRGVSLENGVLRDLEKAALEGGRGMRQDFIITASGLEGHTWEDMARKLKLWLVQRYEGEPGGLDKAATQLGVSRATIYNWKRDREDLTRKATEQAADKGAE